MAAALRVLDTLVQLSVAASNLTAPPATPTEGQRWIVAPGATGMWSGHDNAIAIWQDSAWVFFAPSPGWIAFDTGVSRLLVFIDGAWGDASAHLAALQNMTLLGIGTTADATNPFSAKLNNALWTARTAGEGGDGNLRYKMNKETASGTVSLLMQTGFSGRAEIGLSGDDDLHCKVSPDGTTFHESMVFDRTSGKVKFPAGISEQNTGALVSTFLPAPAVAEIWRSDATRTATPRSYTIAAVSGATLDLTSARVAEIFSVGMRNVSMVRIWNTSKSPAQPAWVNWDNSATQLNVANAADIATWAAGDTVALGDPNPSATNVLGMIAVDISNYMQNNFGAVFRQKGLLLATYVSGTGGDVACDFSGTGANGSATGGNSLSNGARNQANFTIVTPTLSPISNSNLLFVRESLGAGTALATTFARLAGFYV